ncbi:MAG: anti-sigma regulatory factor [Chitinophagales bacterium]
MMKYNKLGKALIEPDQKHDIHKFKLVQPSDNESVVIRTRQIANKAGFNTTDEVMIATAASELATNILRYASPGDITISIVHSNDKIGVEILAQDQGLGIRNLELAMSDNYSTSKMSLGMGLPSVQRIMDELEIESELNHGTRVLVRKWR